jgi:transcriptional regulator with XRE-family HTH domain
MLILSNTQAVAARSALNLSQAKVANDTGLNRAYLSRFEGGKMVLDDRWLDELYIYYEEQGWNPEKDATVEDDNDIDTLRMRDGFQISAALDDVEVEELLNDYYNNQLKIEVLAKTETPKGFLIGMDEERAEKYALELMSLTCLQDHILRRLRGHDSAVTVQLLRYRHIETIGQYAGVMLVKALKLEEPEAEEFS